MVVERVPVEMLMLRDRLYNWAEEKKKRICLWRWEEGQCRWRQKDIKRTSEMFENSEGTIF